MIISETLAIVAVAIQFVLPSEIAISLTIPHRTIGLPLRWVAPLLLIAIAGALSLVALFNMYWRLAHMPIAAVGQ
jgi:hypothetical protein